ERCRDRVLQRDDGDSIEGSHPSSAGPPQATGRPSGGSERSERGGTPVAPDRPKPLGAPSGGSSVAPGRPKPLGAPSGGSERSERGGSPVAPGRPKPLGAPSGGSERSERGGSMRSPLERPRQAKQVL